MPTSTSQSSPVAQPATSPVPVHDFVTPVVREIPRGPVEPASFASVWYALDRAPPPAVPSSAMTFSEGVAASATIWYVSERLVGLLDGPRDLDPRVGIELAEHVADVRLDRLRAQEQLARDLAVGLAVDDQPGDLELTRGEGRDAGLIGVARSRSAMDPSP